MISNCSNYTCVFFKGWLKLAIDSNSSAVSFDGNIPISNDLLKWQPNRRYVRLEGNIFITKGWLNLL